MPRNHSRSGSVGSYAGIYPSVITATQVKVLIWTLAQLDSAEKNWLSRDKPNFITSPQAKAAFDLLQKIGKTSREIDTIRNELNTMSNAHNVLNLIQMVAMMLKADYDKEPLSVAVNPSIQLTL